MFPPREIKDFLGRTIGFVCAECGELFQSMWGNKCNKCRREIEYHEARMRALRSK